GDGVWPGDGQPRRREVLRSALGGALAAGVGAWAAPGWGRPDGEAEGAGLIVRNRWPLDAETPPEALESWETPNRLFFVRSHFGAPAVGLFPWKLEIVGLVDKPLSLGLDDLKGLETVTLPAVLQCSGNGRSYFSPKVPGVGWSLGAVGNAEWSG